MSYKVGTRVVCVDAQFDMSDPGFTTAFKYLPVKGKIYTIREFDDPMVLLEEIVNPEVPVDLGFTTIMAECGFDKRRLKPLVEDTEELVEEVAELMNVGENTFKLVFDQEFFGNNIL